MGKPKQLLFFNNKPLLQHVIEQAQMAALGPVVVTLGDNAADIKKSIDFANVDVVDNAYWEQGMSSSIKVGLNRLLEKYPSTDALMIMTCDQPFVSSGLLQQIAEQQKQTRSIIVVSLYDDTMGPPALFHQSLFDELTTLEGDKGARGIIKKYVDEVSTVSFAKGNIDIDTAQDYEKLQQIENRK